MRLPGGGVAAAAVTEDRLGDRVLDRRVERNMC